MNTDDINELLPVKKSAFEIVLVNKTSGVNVTEVPVYEDNTLGQILKEYADDLGMDPRGSKYIFENRWAGTSTSDCNITVKEFALQPGGVLVLTDEGSVAGSGSTET